MACGIGGRTIEEAKLNISHDEFVTWVQYRRRRGSLNIGNRLESGFALVASMINQACGGKKAQEDYMPHADKMPDDGDDF